MSSNNKKLLSAAIIVKNEEHNIRRCLDSIKDVCDEIIVVDTGSTDNTPEIVKEYTDKLYFHEWQGSFSEARNYSFKYPTCEWVLYIDADEELSLNFQRQIREVLKKTPKKVNTFYLPMKNFLDVQLIKYDISTMPRIFRNGTVYFENIVHNQPVFKPEVKSINLEMLHYGYIWTRNLRQQKYQRMKSMINKHLEETQDEQRGIYYLCQLYKAELIGKNFPESIKLGMRIYEMLKSAGSVNTPIGFELLYILSLQLIERGFLETGFEIASFGQKLYPTNPDFYICLFDYYYKIEDYTSIKELSKKFFKVYRKAMVNIDKFPLSISAMKYIQVVHFIIAKASISSNDIDLFKKSLRLAMNEPVLENPNRFIQDIIIEIANLDKTDIVKIKKEIVDFFEYCKKKNINLSWQKLIEKIGEEKIDFDYYFQSKSPFHDLIAKKIVNPELDFFTTIITGNAKTVDFINNRGHLAFIFFYDILRQKMEWKELADNLKALIPYLQHDMTRGILFACLGDCYIKTEKFSEAISNYKEALKYYSDLHQFIKPVLEDLSIKLDATMDGTFEEIKRFFSEKRELVFDFTSYTDDFFLERLHLVSDYYIALYISAIHQKEPQKGIELLERLTTDEMNQLPFYYIRKADLHFKLNQYTKCIESNRLALEKFNWLGDIKNQGIYPYAGYYFERKNDFYDEEDPIIWVGNISQYSNLYGIINPLKIWRIKQDGLIYSEYVPQVEAITAYEKKVEETNKHSVKEKVDLYILKKVFSSFIGETVNIKGIEIDEEITHLLNQHGIKLDDEAGKVILLKGVEQEDKIETIIDLNDIESGMILYTFPVNKTYANPLWFDPLNVVYRSPIYMKVFFKQNEFKVKMINDEKSNMIYFERNETNGD